VSIDRAMEQMTGTQVDKCDGCFMLRGRRILGSAWRRMGPMLGADGAMVEMLGRRSSLARRFVRIRKSP
jgi:hypothetical protein